MSYLHLPDTDSDTDSDSDKPNGYIVLYKSVTIAKIIAVPIFETDFCIRIGIRVRVRLCKKAVIFIEIYLIFRTKK